MVNVYDSVYNRVDNGTKDVVHNLLGFCKVQDVSTPKQKGGKDCGVYAIAITTALAFGHDPAAIHFSQASMQTHLCQCIDMQNLLVYKICNIFETILYYSII